VSTLALQLPDGSDKHGSSRILLSYRDDNLEEPFRHNPKGFTGPNCTTIFIIMSSGWEKKALAR